MALGDYKKNRRKTTFVATGDLFSSATTGSVSQPILRGTVVVDPLSCSDTTTSTLTFVAPYSRHYQIRLVAAFNAVAVVTAYIPSFFTTVDERLGSRVAYLSTGILRNGVGVTSGLLQTTGDLSVAYDVNGGNLTLTSPAIFSDAESNTTIYLNSGDICTFTYTSNLLQLYTKSEYQGSITDATSGLGNNGTLSLAGTVPGTGIIVSNINLNNLIFSFQNQPSTKLADLSISAAYYLEIFELDRE